MTTDPQATATAARPDRWAQPIELSGVPNLHRVTEDLYRSGQPTRQGFGGLIRHLGVRSVVSLRAFHADDVLAGGQDLLLTRVPLHTWHIEDDAVAAALRAIRRERRSGPVLLHCQHGADRTGLVSAFYRILFEGWTQADALAEMRRGDFGYHAVWGNIPTYLRKADIAALRKAIGPA